MELSAQTIGLVDSDGNLDAGWFQAPESRLRSILSDSVQRAALFNLLETVLPAEDVAGSASDEKWHPLLDPNSLGNIYLIQSSASDHADFGFGALIQSDDAQPATQLRLRLPLVRCAGPDI